LFLSTRTLIVSVGLAAVTTGGAAQDRNATASVALDHVVLAANDLEASAARFRSFGFALKPGRPHDNGIRNQHVKFRDGTELELLTAPEARDDLTNLYRRHLEAGDGPAFLALMALPAAPSRADTPAYIFFGRRNHSPTDLPEHFAHANTAESLVAVWLAGADFAREKAMLGGYGATVALRPRRVIGFDSEVVPVGEGGAIWLLPERARVRADRPIVGVTLRVRSIREVGTILHEAGVAVTTAAPGSLLIPPAAAGGLWIEFSAGAP
jgi:catechol 2,3-dioxygenase-like lactoylglutathione lyase family enzyme